ncbi:proline dehydrogenase family protein [Nocardioides hwasunensis]|uniref:proline dehydrogenase n=1 Tax=Nocardioides hwasunensis TaxID=397258 RepID=A0ABR8MJT9_9ACTN|nr:proline dehydrogenase family protein [Nocardioides hwasunensis]MBD3915556.1 proline dehydrogenase family protein [Nocardioides hwasunensis]
MLSSTLLRASRSPRARRAVETIPASRRVVSRFVAGEQPSDAVAATLELARTGRTATIDVLGEDVRDDAGARRTRDAYLALVTALAAAGAQPATDLSLKLSALGQAIPRDGAARSLEHARQICASAAEHGFTVTLDMEDHTTVDATLAAGEELRRDFAFVGNVLQSNLRRTSGDIEQLGSSSTRLRLVKGAYREPESVAFARKWEVDEAYAHDVTALFASSCYPMIATHDAAMLAHAVDEAARHDHPAWETQMLYGIATSLQQDAVAEGRHLRVYVPVGTDWYGYFMRRLAERPANVAFFLRALTSR